MSGESVVIVGRREMNSGMKLPTSEHGSVKDRQEECAPELDEVRWLDGFEDVWRHTAVWREEGHGHPTDVRVIGIDEREGNREVFCLRDGEKRWVHDALHPSERIWLLSNEFDKATSVDGHAVHDDQA